MYYGIKKVGGKCKEHSGHDPPQDGGTKTSTLNRRPRKITGAAKILLGVSLYHHVPGVTISKK
jgi:hypothetical protein